ncbi:MAG: class IV adenylate cyclase [Candidatus Marinimicrobia bacterium]|nr:class IV adenylate cyclase [Candidatus Neomarinimicrobiota bacterium]
MPITIIEIKAHCDDQDKIRDILKEERADFKGLDIQTDTYFRVPHGRLKLREGNIENNLIHYDRQDKEGPKQSNVLLYKSAPDSNLKGILMKALGVLVVVEKKREIYFIDNIKFHIDTVARLGEFIEIEAIDEDGSIGKERLQAQCEQYLTKFSIHKNDLIDCSYSDLFWSEDENE